MSKIEKFSSERGKPLVVYDSHIYNLERSTNVKLIFRCQNRDCIKVKYKFSNDVGGFALFVVIFFVRCYVFLYHLIKKRN